MNKEKIIKESATYSKIISTGNSVKNKFYSIYYQNNEKTLFGITVPKKIGKAHIRNKLKRRVKNIIMTNEFAIQKDYNYVIIIKEATLKLNYQEMACELINLFKKVGK